VNPSAPQVLGPGQPAQVGAEAAAPPVDRFHQRNPRAGESGLASRMAI
jgi:hypothetical protein